jgi:hypothetical protein
MNINKKIVSSFVIIMSAMLCAMEEKLVQSQELIRSQSRNSPSLMEYMGSCITSTYNTVNNYISDDAAFIKLGWPTTNTVAQQELKDTLIIQHKVNNAIKDNKYYDEFDKDYITLNNRQYYCQRVLKVLPKHPQAVALALFCLQHHRTVMHSFDLKRFVKFVNIEQEKAQKAGEEFSQLTILPEDDDQLLDTLLEQTFLKKYPKDPEQHKEEEKKVKAEKKNGKK